MWQHKSVAKFNRLQRQTTHNLYCNREHILHKYIFLILYLLFSLPRIQKTHKRNNNKINTYRDEETFEKLRSITHTYRRGNVSSASIHRKRKQQHLACNSCCNNGNRYHCTHSIKQEYQRVIIELERFNPLIADSIQGIFYFKTTQI